MAASASYGLTVEASWRPGWLNMRSSFRMERESRDDSRTRDGGSLRKQVGVGGLFLC